MAEFCRRLGLSDKAVKRLVQEVVSPLNSNRPKGLKDIDFRAGDKRYLIGNGGYITVIDKSGKKDKPTEIEVLGIYSSLDVLIRNHNYAGRWEGIINSQYVECVNAVNNKGFLDFKEEQQGSFLQTITFKYLDRQYCIDFTKLEMKEKNAFIILDDNGNMKNLNWIQVQGLRKLILVSFSQRARELRAKYSYIIKELPKLLKVYKSKVH